jgi:membrane associated rhomboid family serine protease
MEGKLAGLFTLIPSYVSNKSDFWRLITFPLAPGSYEGILLFIFTFYFIAPKLEELLNNNFFPFFLLLLIFLEGLLHTVIFWKSNIPLAGFEGLSFFILTLFTMISPNKQVKFWFFSPIKLIYLTSIVILSWGIIKLFSILSPSTNYIIYQATLTSGFGIISGLLIFVQIYFLSRFYKKKQIPPVIDIPKPEELKMALHSHSGFDRYSSHLDDDYYEMSNDPEMNEQRLNEILDKINEHGQNSLSNEERRFLIDYSKKI